MNTSTSAVSEAVSAAIEEGNLRIFNLPTYHDFLECAATVGAATGSVMFPGTLFRQGNRWCLSAALTMNALAQVAVANSAKVAGGSTADVRRATNRPLDNKHAKAIGRYVIDARAAGEPYIIPSLTLNMEEEVDVYTFGDRGPTLTAMMVMPVGTAMAITDGQHRAAGLAQAIQFERDRDERDSDEDTPPIGREGVSVMITFTNKKSQVHQDFADCGKTKAISANVLAVFDSRNTANRLTLDLIEGTPLFRHTVDSVKTTISARSVKVWTVNQIRLATKWALNGGQCSDDVLAETAQEVLGPVNGDTYKAFITGLQSSLSVLAQCNSTIGELAKLTPESLSAVPTLRERGCLLMTASGLAVWAYVWGKIREMKQGDPTLDTDAMVRRLCSVDWSASNPLFSTNLKIVPDRTQTGQKFIKQAGQLILHGTVESKSKVGDGEFTATVINAPPGHLPVALPAGANPA